MYKVGFPLMDEAGGEGEGGGGRDYSKEAAALGHVPKEKWTGDPEKWVDAETFVTRGETVLPIVLKTNRDLKTQVETLQTQLKQIQKDAVEFKTMLETASKREAAALAAQYQEALEARAEAVGAGDKEAFKTADAEAKRLEEEAKKIQDAGTKKVEPPKDVHPDFEAWVSKPENKWFTENLDYQDEADAYAIQINKTRSRKGQDLLRGNPLYELVSKEMVRRHPDIEDGTESRGTTVESDSSPSSETRGRSNGRGKARTYANLPPDAKAACDKFIKQGFISDKDGKTMDEKRAAYCKNYDWD